MAKAKTPSKPKATVTSIEDGGASAAAKAAKKTQGQQSTATDDASPKSALQTSSAQDSNGRNGDVPLPSPATASAEGHPSVTQEQIRRRAYDLYMQRGGTHGMDAEDWFRAEAELLGRTTSKAS
jgi:hypothetical protein